MRFFSLTGAEVGRSIVLVRVHRETRFLGCHSEGSSAEESLTLVRHERIWEEECIQKSACQAPSGKSDALLGAWDTLTR